MAHELYIGQTAFVIIGYGLAGNEFLLLSFLNSVHLLNNLIMVFWLVFSCSLAQMFLVDDV